MDNWRVLLRILVLEYLSLDQANCANILVGPISNGPYSFHYAACRMSLLLSHILGGQRIHPVLFQWLWESFIQLQQVRLVAAEICSDIHIRFFSVRFFLESFILVQLLKCFCVLGREARKCGNAETCSVGYNILRWSSDIVTIATNRIHLKQIS